MIALQWVIHISKVVKQILVFSNKEMIRQVMICPSEFLNPWKSSEICLGEMEIASVHMKYVYYVKFKYRPKNIARKCRTMILRRC